MVVWLNEGQGSKLQQRPSNKCSKIGTGNYQRQFLNQNEADSVAAMKSKYLISTPSSENQSMQYGYCCSCMPRSGLLCNRNFYQIYGLRNILNYPLNMFARRYFRDFLFCYTRRHTHSYMKLKCSDPNELKLSPETIEKAGLTNIRRCLDSVATGFNMAFIRLVGYIFFKLFPAISRGIVVDEGRIKAIKEAREYLARQNGDIVERCPCVFLPLHTSHLDYLILALIAFCNDFPLPFVGAGNNLDIPIVKYAIKMTGGFFIKRGGSNRQQLGQNSLSTISSSRSLGMFEEGVSAQAPTDDGDAVSRAVLRWTLQTLLSNNQSVEFYIEGTRTRSGRPCSPRTGLLSLLVDCLDKNDIPDVCIVPTTFTYERVWELDDLVKEQLGVPKKSENLWSSIKAVYYLLRAYCGLVRVDFCEPFSLREFVERVKNMDATQSGSVVIRNALSPGSTSPSVLLTASLLAQHVIYDCARIAPITLTHALAFLLLTKFRQGENVRTIEKNMLLLRREIIARGYNVTFSDDEDGMIDAVNYAAKVLGNAVVKCETLVEDGASSVVFMRPCKELRSFLTLNYCAARTLIPFVSEAVVATAFVAASKLSKSKLGMITASLNAGDYRTCSDEYSSDVTADTEFSVDQNVLLERAEVLARLLGKEFVFTPPCRSLSAELHSALNRLLNSNVLRFRDAPTRPYVNPDVADPQADSDDEDLSDSEELQFFNHSDSSASDDEPHFTVPSSLATPCISRGPTIELEMMNALPAAKRLIELHGYLLPLLESLWVTACNVASFVDDPTHVQRERDFVSLCQRDAIDTYEDGNICYAESASIITLSNAVKCFEQLRFVQRRSSPDRSGTYLELGSFAASHSNLNIVEGLISLLEYFRLFPGSEYPGRSSPHYVLIHHILKN